MKKRGLIIVGLLNFVLLSTLLGLGLMSYRQTAATQAAEKKLGELLSQRQGLLELKQLLASRREEQMKIESALVDELRVANLLEQLEVIARQVGVSLEVTSVSADQSLAVNMGVRGSYAAIVRYQELLSTLRYPTYFSRVSLQTAPGAKNWSGTMEMKVLSYKK
jgi:hypothetical protein